MDSFAKKKKEKEKKKTVIGNLASINLKKGPAVFMKSSPYCRIQPKAWTTKNFYFTQENV